MWLNLSAKNRHRQERKWKKRGSLWVCEDGSWLTSVYNATCKTQRECAVLQATTEHDRNLRFVWKFQAKHLVFHLTLCKNCTANTPAGTSQFMKTKECKVTHVTAEQTSCQLFSLCWASANPVNFTGMHSCSLLGSGNHRQTEDSPEVMWRLSHNCWSLAYVHPSTSFCLYSVILDVPQNPSDHTTDISVDAASIRAISEALVQHQVIWQCDRDSMVFKLHATIDKGWSAL